VRAGAAATLNVTPGGLHAESNISTNARSSWAASLRHPAAMQSQSRSRLEGQSRSAADAGCARAIRSLPPFGADIVSMSVGASVAHIWMSSAAHGHRGVARHLSGLKRCCASRCARRPRAADRR
jgi:hypothetical protein